MGADTAVTCDRHVPDHRPTATRGQTTGLPTGLNPVPTSARHGLGSYRGRGLDDQGGPVPEPGKPLLAHLSCEEHAPQLRQ